MDLHSLDPDNSVMGYDIHNATDEATNAILTTDVTTTTSGTNEGGVENKNTEDENNAKLEEDRKDKVPYKSFKKKYRKMEIKFAKVMARSEELYKQSIQAKKVFDKVLREKYQLLDILLELNESPHISDKVKQLGANLPRMNSCVKDNGDISYDEPFQIDLSIWNDDVKHLSMLYDTAYEYSEDDANSQPPRNPMCLLEWLRRNQPNVFAPDLNDQSLDPNNGPNAGQGGNGGSSPPPASMTLEGEEYANTPVSKRKKRRAPTNGEGMAAAASSSLGAKKVKKTRKYVKSGLYGAGGAAAAAATIASQDSPSFTDSTDMYELNPEDSIHGDNSTMNDYNQNPMNNQHNFNQDQF